MRYVEKDEIYNLRVTVTSASFIGKAWNVRQSKNGLWLMSFYVKIVRTGAAITEFDVDIEGVEFGPELQTCSCYADTGAEAPSGLQALVGVIASNRIKILHASADTLGYNLQGEVMMTAKPDWIE